MDGTPSKSCYLQEATSGASSRDSRVLRVMGIEALIREECDRLAKNILWHTGFVGDEVVEIVS